jgi:hypothetical protein
VLGPHPGQTTETRDPFRAPNKGGVAALYAHRRGGVPQPGGVSKQVPAQHREKRCAEAKARDRDSWALNSLDADANLDLDSQLDPGARVSRRKQDAGTETDNERASVAMTWQPLACTGERYRSSGGAVTAPLRVTVVMQPQMRARGRLAAAQHRSHALLHCQLRHAMQ